MKGLFCIEENDLASTKPIQEIIENLMVDDAIKFFDISEFYTSAKMQQRPLGILWDRHEIFKCLGNRQHTAQDNH